jgi:hypothetical protein
MLPDLNVSSLGTKRDAELEWLLCLAATHQVCQPRPVNFGDEGRSLPQSAYLSWIASLVQEGTSGRTETGGIAED